MNTGGECLKVSLFQKRCSFSRDREEGGGVEWVKRKKQVETTTKENMVSFFLIIAVSLLFLVILFEISEGQQNYKPVLDF